MGTSPENVKGWLGVVMLVWPIARLLLMAVHVNLPEIPGLNIDAVSGASGAAGTYLLAKAEPLKKSDIMSA